MLDRKFAVDTALQPSAALPARRLPVPAPGLPRRLLTSATYDFAFPWVLYTCCFFILTYPLVLHWSTSFYCDQGDGLQNEWNLWWIRKAILQLHQSPWYTTWLHAPQGTTLIGHTLNPINGLIGIPLSFIFSRVEVYNLIVTGSFAASGVTAFWLARHVCRSYVGALFGGFAFTFTGYHFAHAYGHMQLISMEFVPLFVLAWLRMLENPSTLRAVIAGSVLGLIAFCDFYYVFYCALAGALCGLFYLGHLSRFAQRPGNSAWYLLLRFGVFLIVVCAWCGPFFVPLLIVNERDPFDGAHNAVFFSADAFSAFVPGGANMLGRFTEAYWSKLTGDIPDQCVYVGLTVLAMAFFGAVNSFRRIASAGYWIALAMCSYGLSLGPVLHIHGIAETGEILPYAGLEGVLPLLKLSGVPSRMTVMLALALSVLLALGVSTVLRSRAKYSTLLMALFAIVMAIDLAPIHLPSTPVYYPAWTAALRDLPLKGAVISQVDDRCLELYYQTLYDRPMAFGYISRVPASVELRDQWIIELARERNFAALRRDMGFVYLVLPRKTPMPGLPIVYRDADVNIQELPG